MGISVREAVTEDAQRVRDIHLAAIEGLGGQAYTEEQVAVWAHDRDPGEYPIGAEDTCFLVAETETAVVGFGWLNVDPGGYFRTAVGGEITAIYVHPSVARNGVGSRIYTELEARAVGWELGSLGLLASRNAVPFYEAHGYERVGTHDHEYRDGITLGLVEMTKRLR